MESRAFVENISRSFGGDYLITLRLDGIGRTELEGLNNSTPYRLKLGKWTERRSLDANAYMWVLCSKMSEVLGTSKDEVYEELLQRYGLVDEEVVITVKKSVDMSKVEGHWHLLKSDDKWCGYIRIRGTSEYDRREMAHFLDMVVEDAKELGVEVLTPTELERLKEAWGENSTPRQ